MTRRLGFEYNGMVLHEYYFGNLKPGGSAQRRAASSRRPPSSSFGSSRPGWRTSRPWPRCRASAGRSRYQDPRTGWLSNHWITLHETATSPASRPILVMDAWEHAFVPDYKPTERAKYVEAYFSNIDWGAAESRLK